MSRPELIVLDVNETLSDLSGMEAAFVDLGLPATDVPAWFAGVLRDGFALTVLGDNPAFADLAQASIRVKVPEDRADEAAEKVIEAFLGLRPHPDVVDGLLALADLGCRLVTLSNGSAGVARALLAETRAGEVIEDYLSVADAPAWKPAAAAYEHALRRTGVGAGAAMLVAVHPWDLESARRAGLRTAWINRSDGRYPNHFSAPEVEATSLLDLAERLA